MQIGQGVFVAIEGSDGSGKQTQVTALAEQLAAQGYDIAVFDFPQYDAPSSFFVREYLSGKYGSADQVGPYTASLFYALDRYQVAGQIRQALSEGKVVLANRFVGSNMAHQGTKFHYIEERRGYFIWLDNLEYEMLHVPRPTMSFVLRVPAEVSAQLMQARAKDIHEADLTHLQKAVDVYDDMCQLFPKDFTRIDCMRNGKLQDVATIQQLIWKHVQPLLPPASKKQGSITHATSAATPQPAQTAAPVSAAAVSAVSTPPKAEQPNTYYVPEALPEAVAANYRNTMDQLLKLYAEMAASLGTGQDSAEALAELRSVLPVAVAPPEILASSKAPVDPQLHTLAQDTPDTYGQAAEPLQLTDIWPRNELDIVADILYPYTNLSLSELRTITATWPYTHKTAALEAGFSHIPASDSNSAFEKVRYSWDIVSEYSAFYDMQQQGILRHISWQPLTPRYGYDIPATIEAAGLTDAYETCFELSLHLYSSLQAAGFAHEAQYATLYGHRMRWKVSYNVATAATLYDQLKYPAQAAQRQLLAAMLEKLHVAHPVISDLLRPAAE